MKYLALILLISTAAHAGEWTRVSPNTIALHGEITKEDVENFRKIYRPTDTTVILNSTGGLIEPALTIAQTLIKNKKLETVVHGICASSCANYLFLSGKTRKIDHGVVGYHGSLEAYLESERFRNDLSQAAKTIDPKTLAKQIRKTHQLAKEEAAFFDEAGVPKDQELFTRTQIENDSGLYDIYVPGPNAFLKYGIRNVVGVEDLDLMRSMIENDKFQILYDNSSSTGPVGSASTAIR